MSVSHEMYERERDKAERLELDVQQLRRQLDARNEIHEDLRNRIDTLEKELARLKTKITTARTIYYDLDRQTWDGPDGLGQHLIDVLPSDRRRGEIAFFVVDKNETSIEEKTAESVQDQPRHRVSRGNSFAP